MKILLINNNPVVSRLTALSARKENIEIDEIQEVTELNSNTYDIIFVDDDSYSNDVKDIIKEYIKTKKSVLFYAEGDNEHKDSFDLAILKPFLPSEVSAIIRSLEGVSEDVEETNFDILAEAKESGRDELFALNDLDDKKITVEADLKDEISQTFDEKLEDEFSLKSTSLDDELFEDKEVDKKLDKVEISEEKELKTEELFDLDLADEKLTLEDDLFKKEESPMELLDLDEEKSSLSSLEVDEDILMVETTDSVNTMESDLVLESDTSVLEESNNETKILDKAEIENIKGLLSDDIDTDEMTLDDLMPLAPLMSLDSSETSEVEKEAKKDEKKVEKKKVKKEKSSMDIESNVLMATVASLPVEKLRELLAGARVNISIKFPKAK